VGTWEVNKGFAVAKTIFSEDFTFSAQVVSFFGGKTATGILRADAEAGTRISGVTSRHHTHFIRELISKLGRAL